MLHVEAMSVLAVGSRVEVELVTTKAVCFIEQPAHQRISVAPSPERGLRDEVVHVEIGAPREIVSGPKAGYRNGVVRSIVERSDQSVSLRSLKSIDLPDECLQRRKVGSKLHHGEEDDPGLTSS
ncbi:MAG: hypothetical protein QOG21_1143 [Actinomycetota bacterium]|nr:hypothetical protein [Actinomycetota bacterium]